MRDPERPTDPVGPGTGGIPTTAARPTSIDRDAPQMDEDVKALIDELDTDGQAPRADVVEASEQIGTGTDR